MTTRDGVMETYRAHNPEAVGSNPALATMCKECVRIISSLSEFLIKISNLVSEDKEFGDNPIELCQTCIHCGLHYWVNLEKRV